MDRLDRIEKAIEALQKSQAKTDAQLAKTDAQLAKTDAQLAKTDAQLARTEKQLSNIGINLGHTAEEFFFYALKDNKKLGKVQFDDIEHNVKAKNRKIEDEFDIVLYNGDSIGLVEVKHKVHPNDIEKLKTKKIENFKLLFPYYANCKFYLGIGGVSFPEETARLALKNGIAVLRQKGALFEMDDASLLVY